ncbi:MAG: folate-binding protein [Cyanobacteriota bacterium]|nr:folate-binding protein [Cyanobacteriota bacterium]
MAPVLTGANGDPWAWRPPQPSRLDQLAGLLRLDGADTRRFLHGQTSQAIEAAAPGRWLAGCAITATARLRALVEVLVDDTGAWLLIHGADPEPVRAALDRVLFPADQVRLGPLESVRLLRPVEEASPVAGPGTPPPSWQPLDGEQGLAMGSWLVLRANAAVPAAMAARPPLPAAAAELWRLQRGEPQAPGEINDTTNPFEVGLADRVSLSKGCYVGQETLAKLATYNGVHRQLRRCWQVDPGAAAPQPGDQLQDSTGERAGVITSGLALPQGGWVGLALVRRQALANPSLMLAEGGSLQLSIPTAFVAPPVGPGGGA